MVEARGQSTRRRGPCNRALGWAAGVSGLVLAACGGPPPAHPGDDPAQVAFEVEAAVWAFHAADTARDAEAVIDLLWPDYYMLADGNPLSYADVVAGSRDFMGTLELFHTEWTRLRVTPLGSGLALASFNFRDSIITSDGDLIRSQGPTTFLWERRDGRWRLRFADSDHYPIDP